MQENVERYKHRRPIEGRRLCLWVLCSGGLSWAIALRAWRRVCWRDARAGVFCT